MNILVTGAAGNIGSALVEKLIQSPGTYVVGVDNFLTGHISKLPLAGNSNFKFVEADVNEPDAITDIMRERPFDYVFHYAAVVGVKRTIENPIAVLNDIQGIRFLLEASRNSSVKRVFFSSSSEVYGEPVEFPQNENTTPLNSRLPYAIVKNVGEAFLRSFHKNYGLEYTIFRFFNTYGPRQSNDFVITKFIKLALADEPITLYGEGTQTRTFCYIDDNIDVVTSCLFEGHCINDVINVGNEDEYTIISLAYMIIDLLGSKSEVIHLPALTEGDMTRRKPDITKMRSILTRELLPLEKGILKVADHFRRSS